MRKVRGVPYFFRICGGRDVCSSTITMLYVLLLEATCCCRAPDMGVRQEPARCERPWCLRACSLTNIKGLHIAKQKKKNSGDIGCFLLPCSFSPHVDVNRT